MTAAQDLGRLERLYAVSSGINEAIVRIPGERALFEEACRIAVEKGQLLMAWVGLPDASTGVLAAAASWGKDEGYLDAISVTTSADLPEGVGPAGEAFRTGAPAVCNDIEADMCFFASRTEALARGYRSCAAFPLYFEGRTIGVFVAYSARPLHFNRAELDLLSLVASNFSFAIEARRKDEQTRALADRLTETLESITDAFLTMDRQWRFTYVNRQAERMLQRPRAEMLGKVAWDEFPQADGVDFRGHYEESMATNEPVEFESLYEPLGIWFQVRAYPSPQGLAVYFRDVTGERKAREEILRLNAELEDRVQQRTAQLAAANRELEAFSYSVSHDLRTPLSTIDGFSSMIEKQLARGEIASNALHYISRVRQAARHMGELIDAMLSLAHLSRASLQWQPVDLTAISRIVLEELRSREPQRAVDIEVQAGMSTQGDTRLLKQVMENLLGNAWKFTRLADGAKIRAGCFPDDSGYPIYFVKDNGAGFDMAHAGKLFGAFQRLHADPEFPGTGIGLANVQRIVARHGGRVWAEAAPQEGATFYFTLGAAPQAGAAPR
jgi:PAS domain S-box-containing protein